MGDQSEIPGLFYANLQMKMEQEKCDKVIGIIKELDIKDFGLLRDQLDKLTNSVSITYTIEDVDLFLASVGVTLNECQKMEILNDFIENVLCYGGDWQTLMPWCIKDYIESLQEK